MPPALIEELFAHPYEFDFFHAVYLLELAGGDRLSVGLQGPPNREAVRFRALPSMNFPPSSIYSLGKETPPPNLKIALPPVMTVAFFGLTGPNGALPVHYTQQIIKQLERGRGDERTALRDWLDLFNHRLTSIFYRSWEKYRFGVPFLRYLRARSLAQGGMPGAANTMQVSVVLQARRAEPDPFTLSLFNLIGLGPIKLRNRLQVSVRHAEVPGELGDEAIDHQRLAGIDDLALLHYGGLFAQRPRNTSALAAIIGDYFRLPVRVVQFSGQWLAIPESQQSRMEDDGNNQLGMNAVAGERIWDVCSSFRLRIGPLDLATFQDLLPDRAPRPRRKTFFLLCQLVRLYVGPEFDFEVQLVLDGREVPELQMKDGGRDVIGPRLGWNTWLKDGPMPDADDAFFAGDETNSIPADVRVAG